MVFKFIDGRGNTHFRECSEVSYVGFGQGGYDEALRYNGEPGEILNYDVGPGTDPEHGVGMPTRYFVIYPPEGGGPRQVIATACSEAWLMSDKGRTIENLMVL